MLAHTEYNICAKFHLSGIPANITKDLKQGEVADTNEPKEIQHDSRISQFKEKDSSIFLSYTVVRELLRIMKCQLCIK